jgi:hypothetical protein
VDERDEGKEEGRWHVGGFRGLRDGWEEDVLLRV